MDFELTAEQATLRDVSRSLLEAACPATLVRSVVATGQDLDEKLWQRATEIGWTGMMVPEELDGAGQGVVELCLVAEELGRATAPGPFAESALVAGAAAEAPAGPLAEVAAALAAGDRRASWARAGDVRARRIGDELVLDGHVALVQAGRSVDWIAVVANTDGGQLIVLVDADPSTATPRNTLDQSRTWHSVHLDGVRVPSRHILAEEPATVERMLDTAALLTAADSLGIGERLLEMTVHHTNVRHQFDRAIGSFQVIKHKAADMLTTLKGARGAVYHAAMSLDGGLPTAGLATSAAKAFATEGVSAIAGEALQTHGGIGFTWEHDLHLYLRRAKMDELLDGAPAEHHSRVLELHRKG